MAPSRGRGRTLSADDWVQAGFDLLAAGGPDALRIVRLCEQLGVTKGSFYWHFTDMPAYRTALVSAWGDLRDADRHRFLDTTGSDPRERLATMMTASLAPAHMALERVMRTWALTDAEVAASVRQSDDRLLAVIRGVFVDLGYSPGDAMLRALVMMSAGIGLLHSSGYDRDAPPALREKFLEFMLRP